MEKRYKSVIVRKSFVGTTGVLVAESSNRVGIVFAPQSGFNYSVSTEAMSAITDGMAVGAQATPLVFIGEHYRDIVQKTWNVFSSLANFTINYIEILEA